jgi:outer membrane protein assembly factor BamB
VVLALCGAACVPDIATEPVKQEDSIDLVWRTPLTGSNSGREDLAIDERAFYTLVGGITAYDLTSGTVLWNVPEKASLALNLVASGGRVFVASATARAYDARTGAELWRTAIDSLGSTENAVDERAYYVGTDTRRVAALDVTTGRLLWNQEVLADGEYREGVTGIIVHGDTVYATIIQELNRSGGLKRGWMVALDRHTGRVLWRFLNEKQNEPHDVSRHAVAGRMLLMNDLNGGAIIGVDRFTGQEVWRRSGALDYLGAWDTFKVVDGVAYVASNDTFLYALDPETGRVIWQTKLKASGSASAVCGDKVFASTGGLYMARKSDGKIIATLFFTEQGALGPSHVRARLHAQGNRVYFVGNDAVYAVSCE